DRSVAWDDDDVYRQGDRSLWDTETGTERDGQSNRLEEHRRRGSSCRRAALAFQQPGKPRNIGLLKFGFGNANTGIRPERSHYALLSMEPGAALREGQARKGSHLHLPSIRWTIDCDAEAEDDAFRTTLFVPAHGDSGDDRRGCVGDHVLRRHLLEKPNEIAAQRVGDVLGLLLQRHRRRCTADLRAQLAKSVVQL